VSTVINKIQKKIKDYNSIEYIAYSYRYISVLITSIFFIIFTNYAIPKKTIIIILIIIASITLNYLYYNSKKDNKYILILLMMETFCTAIIIIVTGGLSSPFIWYTFNSMIVCFMMLSSIKYSLLCLLTYLISSTIIPYIIFKDKYTSTFNSNTLLCLILITGLLNILYKSLNDINNKNNELKNANLQIKKSINQIVQLYNTMHIFTIKNNNDDIIQQIMEYSSLIFETENVIFFTNGGNGLSYKDLNNITNLDLINYVNKNYLNISQIKKVLKLELSGKLYVFCPIQYNLKVFGILTLDFEKDEKEEQDSYDSLIFIAELASIVFEKFELEKVNTDLLINEEQNRIANDIHDSVLQRLFSVSCCAYTLIKNIEIYDPDKIRTNLNIIRNSINVSMSDLRKIIYKLSLNKDGNDMFINDIKEYIKEIEELNDVSISFNIEGDTEMLSMLHKRSIYRIICELISNSIRHSKSNNIAIKIDINQNMLLTFKGDGIGFNYNEIMKGEKRGLGLKNIEHLVKILSGSLQIKNLCEKGTVVNIFAPLLTSKNEIKIGE